MKLVDMKKSDLPLLGQWLDSEHIYRWFGEPNFWLAEFGYEPNSFFILEYEEEKIGFCRYTTQIPSEYSLFVPSIVCKALEQTQNSSRKLQVKNETFKSEPRATNDCVFVVPVYFVDYGIGIQKYMGRGCGKKMLELLCDKMASEHNCILFAASSLKNVPSCRILKENGFSYDEQSGLFLKIAV
jgi:hypothetical protein